MGEAGRHPLQAPVSLQDDRSILCQFANAGQRDASALLPYVPQSSAALGGDPKQQFVIIAAGKSGQQRVQTATGEPLPGSRMYRERGRINDGACAALGRYLRNRVSKTVAQIHAGRRGVVSSEEGSNPDSCGWPTMACDTFCDQRILRFATRVPRLGPQPVQPGRGSTDLSGDVERITWPTGRASQNLSWAYGADHRDIDDEDSVIVLAGWGPGEVAAGNRDVRLGGHCGKSVQQCVDLGSRETLRNDEGEQCQSGCRTHRCDIADIDRKRLEADVLVCGKSRVEMDPLNQGVRCEHFERTAHRRRDGRIVSDADDQYTWAGRKTRADSFDERAFAKLPGGSRTANGRTQRRESPG